MRNTPDKKSTKSSSYKRSGRTAAHLKVNDCASSLPKDKVGVVALSKEKVDDAVALEELSGRESFAGEKIYRTLPKGEFEDIAGRILYEDNHLLIFNKRSGEIVQADKTEDECLSTTLKAFVAQRDHKPGAVFMGVTHRLDRPVSGAVVFAKTSKALGRLNEAFRVGDMHKTYWAVVCNRPKESEKLLTHYLTRNEKQNKTYTSTTPKPGAKEARLRYRFLTATERYFLLEVELYTGRHHQIRAQLSTIGCVIKGDLKYGAPRSNPDGSISLHSRRIKFIHPVRKEEMEITAPVFCPVMKSCEGVL